MGRLAFLADEHVNRAYVNVLRSNGFHVVWLDNGYPPGTGDTDLLRRADDNGLITLTNDGDFVELAEPIEHAGIVMYQQYSHTPRTVVRAISRIDRYFEPAEFRNHVEWLERWV